MDGNNVKKDDENGKLDCGIYSSPTAAGLLCKVGSAIARYNLCIERSPITSCIPILYVYVHARVIQTKSYGSELTAVSECAYVCSVLAFNNRVLRLIQKFIQVFYLFIQGLYHCTTNSDPCTINTNLG